MTLHFCMSVTSKGLNCLSSHFPADSPEAETTSPKTAGFDSLPFPLSTVPYLSSCASPPLPIPTFPSCLSPPHSLQPKLFPFHHPSPFPSSFPLPLLTFIPFFPCWSLFTRISFCTCRCFNHEILNVGQSLPLGP